MTSISQPAVPSQISSNASQQPSAPTHSPSPSSVGRVPSQPAGRSNYTGSARKPFSPPPGQYGSDPAVNGKVAVPAVPAVVNGNPGTSGQGDVSRKPSVTISASGPQQYAQNGATISGRPPGSSGIQFGSYNADGSPRLPHASPHQSAHVASSLGVHSMSNPRVISPANSPSPIPQPAASGGKPPSHGHNISVSFGNSGGSDANVCYAFCILKWRPLLIGLSCGQEWLPELWLLEHNI